MPKTIGCPICSRPIPTRPLRSWRYRSADVKRYECQGCKSKFNVYEGPKGTYTIPKRK